MTLEIQPHYMCGTSSRKYECCVFVNFITDNVRFFRRKHILNAENGVKITKKIAREYFRQIEHAPTYFAVNVISYRPRLYIFNGKFANATNIRQNPKSLQQQYNTHIISKQLHSL